ncbi:MAG: hypothetical protein K0U93_00600 [Gammaproteobacteria bacterium]|nr:hypothetical protein [Gammaproteobacteria bacterium]
MGLVAANKLTPLPHSQESDDLGGLDPKGLREWLENLPLMKPAVCISQVLASLTACNHERLSAKQRFALLVVYRRQTSAQFQAFGSTAFHRTVPEQDRDQVVSTMSALLLELSRGFGTLVRTGEQEQTWDPTSPYVHAIYASVQALGFAVLHAIRSHTPLPPGVHLELNRLYSLAEGRDVAHRPVGPTRELCASSIGDLYKQLQLLSAMDPFAIPDADLMAVFAQLGAYAAGCPMAMERPADAKEQVLVIDLAVNAVAFALHTKEELAGCTEPRFLSLAPVLRAAARTEQNRDKSPQHLAQAENAALIRKLLRKKTKKDRDSAQRVPERVIRAAFGLEAIHYFLSDEARRLRQALREPGETKQMRRRANGSIAKLETLLLEDKEDSAYRLRQPGLEHVEASVGELIGVNSGEVDGPYTFELGILMWARHDRQDRLHFAVKRICSGTLPAVCKQAGKAERKSDMPNEVPCLYVPRSNSRTGRSLLLAPAETSWDQLPIWLELAERTKLINLGKRRSDIASIACYEIPGKG